MTLEESINRGYNLMVTVFLFLGGFAFGAVAFSPVENDWFDRLDDFGLPLIGLICLIWFLIGQNRFKRSLIPVVLVGMALAIQMLAVPLEHDDAGAFGDNFGGLIMLAPFFVFVVVQFIMNGRAILLGRRAISSTNQVGSLN